MFGRRASRKTRAVRPVMQQRNLNRGLEFGRLSPMANGPRANERARIRWLTHM